MLWLRFLPQFVAIALPVGFAVAAWHRKQSARHWPMIYGRVEVALALDQENNWFSDLSYSYKVGTEYHSGHFRLTAKNEIQADQQVLAWKGQTLAVRYSPKNPAISVVRMEDQSSLPGAELQII